MRNTIDMQRVVDLLNELNEMDPEAVRMLFFHRVRCNLWIADHQSVQVHRHTNGPHEKRGQYLSAPGCNKGDHSVNFLGLLNGMFGADDDGWEWIAVNLDNRGEKITGFSVLD